MKKVISCILAVLLFCSVMPVSVYAEDMCEIKFDSRGGTPVETIYVKKGEKATAPTPPTKEGCKFGGWFLDEELKKEFDFSKMTIPESATFYAGWYIPFVYSIWNKTDSKPNSGGSYSIYISGNVYAYDVMYALEGSLLAFGAEPYQGYIFDGWYKGNYDSVTGEVTPLDTSNPANLLTNDNYYVFNIERYTVAVAVFEECKNHEWEEKTEKATPTSDGRVYKKCKKCNLEASVKTIYKTSGYKLNPAYYTYNGKQRKPAVSVTDSKGNVVKNDNYTVTYSNNTDAGTAAVTVNFKGDYYTGSKKLTFKINKAKNPVKIKGKTVNIKAATIKKKNYTFAAKKALNISNAKGKLSYKKSGGNKNITINKKTGKITVKKGLKKGNYKVKVKVNVAGNKNYNKITKTVQFIIKIK